MNTNVIDLIQTNSLLKKNSEKVQKNVVLHSKHVEATLYLLQGNIEYLKFVVSKYKNSEKYDYLYNYILNQYNFKMAESESIDKFLRSNGIFRKKSFARIKIGLILSLLIVSSLPFIWSVSEIVGLIAFFICLTVNILACMIKSETFMEQVQFSKIDKSFKGN